MKSFILGLVIATIFWLFFLFGITNDMLGRLEVIEKALEIK